MTKLNVYKGTCDDWESTVLIFAYNHNQARNIAYKAYKDFDCEYIYARARIVKDKELIEVFEAYKLSDEPHYNDDFPSCETCECFSEDLIKGLCHDCR